MTSDVRYDEGVAPTGRHRSRLAPVVFVDRELWGVAMAGRERAAREDRHQPVALDPRSDIAREIQRVAEEGQAVVVLTRHPDVAAASAAISGVLPILIKQNPASLLEAHTHLEVSSAREFLGVLDAEESCEQLFRLSTQLPSDWTAPLERRNQRFAAQVSARSGVWIFGAANSGRYVLRHCRQSGLPVHGFVDNDTRKHRTRIDGLPVVGPMDLEAAEDAVILASGRHALDVSRQLQRRGFRHLQNLSEFFFATQSAEQPERDFHQDLHRNWLTYWGLFLALADSASRRCLNRIVAYRLDFDLEWIGELARPGVPQWFESGLFAPRPDHVFVDGGAFDGDTAERFVAHNGGGGHAMHLFEIDPDLASQARNRVGHIPQVTVHNVGLSDRGRLVGFSRSGLTDGRMLAGAPLSARVEALDNVVREPVTLLKLDVEGEEERALEGAARQIEEHGPLLAIAAYHKAHDLWAIPRQIARLRPGYSFFVRHYTQVSYETVVYALPDALGAGRQSAPSEP